MFIVRAILLFVRGLTANRTRLAAENLALRQQVALLKRTNPRPRIRGWGRIFWVWLSRLWTEWRSALVIVKPETVIRWHREGFRLYWRWKSQAGPVGRPPVEREIRELIRRLARENPLCDAPRIAAELHFLGYQVADSTVARYLSRGRKPSSPNWRTFLANHVGQIAAIDFFTVPTATFRVLFCFLVLGHARRRAVHFHVTAHPTATWTAQQGVEAFPYDEAPRYLLQDRDSVYGEPFKRRLRVLGEAHLRRILAAYLRYYHEPRPHLALARNAPVPRPVEPPSQGWVITVPQVGGLHRRYARAA